MQLLVWTVVATLAGGPPASGDYVESFRAATTALEAGRLDEAEADLRACLAERPESATCAFHLARATCRAGRLSEARDWIAVAVEWGWDDDAVLAWEPDLVQLRERGELQPLIELAKARAAEGPPHRHVPRLQWNPGFDFPHFSPDGRRLVTGRGGDSFLWDTLSGELVAVLPGGERGIAWADFSPDDRFLVTMHNERVTRVWDALTGAYSHRLEGATPSGGRLTFSTDGSRLLMSAANDAGIWEVATGTRLGGGLPCGDIGILSPDGSLVLCETGLWRVEEAAWLTRFGAIGSPMYSGGFSPDGSLAWILSGETGVVLVYDTTTGERVGTFGGGERARVASALFAGDPPRLLTCDAGRRLLSWDVRSSTSTTIGKGVHAGGGWMATDAGARWLLLSSWRRTDLWDLEHRTLEWSARDTGFRSDLTRDGTLVALPVRSGGDRLELRKTATGAVERVVGWSPVVDAIRLHPGGALLAAARCDGGVDELDVTTGEVLRGREAGSGGVVATEYSADGNWRVDLGEDGRVVLQDRSSDAPPEVLAEITQEPAWRRKIEISADGGRVLAFQPGEVMVVWTRGVGTRTLADETLTEATLSRDGRYVATATRDGLVRVLDAKSGEPVGAEMTHPASVDALAFSPDGEQLATGCDDSFVRVWRWRAGEQSWQYEHVDDFLGETFQVGLVVFSQDGSRLVATTRGIHQVTCLDARTGNLRWVTDFAGGNPVTLPAMVSPDGSRVYVSGSACAMSSVYDGDGHQLADLGTLCPGQLDGTPDGRYVVGLVNGGVCCFDGKTFERRWQRVELSGGGWLRIVPQLVCDGTADALRRTHVVFEDGSAPLECYAERVLDPRRVEAALAGVAVRAPRFPRPPQLELHVQEGERIACKAVATDPDGIRSFTVELDGVRVDPDEVARGTRLDEDGKRAELRLELPRPAGGRDAVLTVRALGRNNVLSRPMRETVASR